MYGDPNAQGDPSQGAASGGEPTGDASADSDHDVEEADYTVVDEDDNK
jgi:hypothetical protein